MYSIHTRCATAWFIIFKRIVLFCAYVYAIGILDFGNTVFLLKEIISLWREHAFIALEYTEVSSLQENSSYKIYTYSGGKCSAWITIKIYMDLDISITLHLHVGRPVHSYVLRSGLWPRG